MQVRRTRVVLVFFFLMGRRPPRSTQGRSSAASDVYKRQEHERGLDDTRHPRRRFEVADIGLDGRQRARRRIGRSVAEHLQQRLHLDRIAQWRARAVRLDVANICLLYTSPSPRDRTRPRLPSSA